MKMGQVLSFKRKRIVNKLIDDQAFDVESAILLNDLNENENSTISGMISEGVVKKTEDGRYFLNQTAVEVYENNQKYFRMILIIFVILAILAIILGVID